MYIFWLGGDDTGEAPRENYGDRATVSHKMAERGRCRDHLPSGRFISGKDNSRDCTYKI